MFNTTNVRTYNTLKVNSVSGNISKTYMESWFIRFHLKSDMAKTYLNGDNKSIIQMVICGDMEVIAEVIRTSDLEKYLLIGENDETRE